MPMVDKDDAERVREANRIIARAAGEGGLTSTPELKARARNVRDHFTAQDADQADNAELWGTRIARGLAAVFFVGLVIYLARFLMS